MSEKKTPAPKKPQKLACKRTSLDALNEATNPNRTKLKINPPREPAPQASPDPLSSSEPSLLEEDTQSFILYDKHYTLPESYQPLSTQDHLSPSLLNIQKGPLDNEGSLDNGPLSSLTPSVINITLFTKTIYNGQEIDSEVLQITFDGGNDLNLVRVHRTQKKMAEKKADEPGFGCHLLSATYITWNNIKKDER